MSALPLIIPKRALFLARGACAAYASDPEAVATALSGGFPSTLGGSLKLFQGGDTEGFLYQDDAQLLVSFRGTATLGDWLYNADLSLVEWAGPGRVHGGFLAALESVWMELDDMLTKMLGDRTLWISGHSQGGALALLAGERWRMERDLRPDGIFMLGAPKVGDRAFARTIDLAHSGRAVAFLNHGDPVPWMPLLHSEFSSTGSSIFFNEEGEMGPRPGALEAAFLFLTRLGTLSREEMMHVKPHSRAEYLRLIEKNFTA